MEPESKAYALITGASQGLGKAFAHELAKRKYNVLLVSLGGEGLHGLCDEIKGKYNVDVHCYETDFCDPQSVYQLSDWVSRFSVFMLINNAGIGGSHHFEEASTDYMDNIIQVNIRTTTLLTRLLLMELKRHEASYVMNISSMASFSPLPFKTVYPASKAFISSFSKGLKTELKGTSVSVSVIHPGPVKTNASVSARIDKMGALGRMGLLSAERLAKLSVDRMLKNRFRVIPGILNKLNWLLLTLIPDLMKLPVLYHIMQRDVNSAATPMQQEPIEAR